MRKLLFFSWFIFSMFIVCCFASTPIVVSVSNSVSQLIIPESTLRQAESWTTNKIYSQGTVVKNLNNFFFALIGGTSTNTGTGPVAGPLFSSDNAVTWAHYIPNKRNGVMVVNDSTSKVYLGIGAPAVVGRGIMLNGVGSSVSLPNYQGSIYATTQTDNRTPVCVAEW